MDRKLWLLSLLIFLFAFGLRLWNLNMMGRWGDEQSYLEKGYALVELAKKGDFSNSFWYNEAADHPPFASYIYGLASYLDFIKYDPDAPRNFFSNLKGAPVYHYDITYTRLISVLVSSFAVVLVFLIGTQYFSTFIGITSSVFLAMLPHFLGFSQLLTLESWIVFLFTFCVFAYLRYLDTGKSRYLIVTGIVTGLALEIKESNILIFPFYIVTFYTWNILTKNKQINSKHFFKLLLITIITCFIVWPMPWFHPVEYIKNLYRAWFSNSGLIPELIFGRLMGAGFYYYPIAFLITTPLVILILSFIGIKESFKKSGKKYYAAVIIWFIVPFLMMFFHHRQHMVSYIIEFYAPLTILAAIGFAYILNLFTKNKRIQYIFICIPVIYLLIILINTSPYYLTYFNELVGGTKNVYMNRLFFIGWFGEGLKWPGVYIAENAPKNSRIGIALNPGTTLYRDPVLNYEKFEQNKKYDYVVVNYFNIVRSGFDINILKKDYKLVYIEKSNGAELAYVYKHK